MKRLYRTLRFQLLFRSLAILALLLCFIGGTQYMFMTRTMYENQAISIQSDINSMDQSVWRSIKTLARSETPAHPNLIYPGVTVAFINQSYKMSVLSEDPNAGAAPSFPKKVYRDALTDTMALHYQVAHNKAGEEIIVVFQAISVDGRQAGVVQMSTLTQPLNDSLFRQISIFAVLSFAALVIGLFVFLPVIRLTLKPLSRIVRLMGDIHAGSLDKRLPIDKRQAEIESLGISINQMLERIETSFQAEKEEKERIRQFVSDASHELRTPLTSIHGCIEMLMRGAAEKPEQKEKALQSMYAESARANKLIEDLLFLAKIDRVPSFEMKKGALGDVILEMEAQLKLLARNRKLEFFVDQKIEAVFDKDKMKQVILNLFYNAVQHTDEDTGVITVSLQKDGGIMLMIADNGTGIAPEHVPHLFDRFYRAETSRSRQSGGAGLGLAITKTIIDSHNGAIEVKSEQEKGSVFIIRLPG
ncbi:MULTISPECIES: sensor histidine kinase [Bacillus amyloliquefaciens group]|uniref:sensor histidine kinase n=1 Tax=Bacillus amyloliquefaciens group TaxID=1938374 RepID=UPI00077D85A1|nr:MULTISPECIES: HAMP domain-containing sensor histidine kinase [Bacillus amyloliquefaciens group]AMQ69670.1 sensor histidine kinase [Bacillus amyloliquefaciens UMAF6639]MCB7142633.1 HAMP domain-containing histidine kinase [Bacillus velezensis]MCC2530774.1 HAMP domain-containing histidine kinase [Bacillus velezensis]MCC2549707.1 HAMP domain-containing histidine kinase [Bacillus velezensis]